MTAMVMLAVYVYGRPSPKRCRRLCRMAASCSWLSPDMSSAPSGGRFVFCIGSAPPSRWLALTVTLTCSPSSSY